MFTKRKHPGMFAEGPEQEEKSVSTKIPLEGRGSTVGPWTIYNVLTLTLVK